MTSLTKNLWDLESGAKYFQLLEVSNEKVPNERSVCSWILTPNDFLPGVSSKLWFTRGRCRAQSGSQGKIKKYVGLVFAR